MEKPAGPLWARLDKPDFWVDPESASAVDDSPHPVPVYVADTRRTRNQGLLKCWSTPGIVWITKCNSIHTVAMHFTIDVAYLRRDKEVLEIVRYPPGRVGRPRFRARSVLEAQPGIFESLGILPGTVFEPRPNRLPEFRSESHIEPKSEPHPEPRREIHPEPRPNPYPAGEPETSDFSQGTRS